MKPLMKSLLSLLLCLFSLIANAQTKPGLPADSATGKVVYEGVIKVPAGVTYSQAFERSQVWLSNAFGNKDRPAVHPASAIISAGGLVKVNDFTYTFRVRLHVNSDQVQYRLDDFSWKTYAVNGAEEMSGTIEQQRDSSLAIGKKARAKILAELDQKVRAGLTKLGTELTGGL